MKSHISNTALVLSSIFLTTTTYGHALCYYPNGDSIATDIPSNITSSNGYAPCCGVGANYYSSGLCIVDGIISRGSCTDKSYSDSACATECRSFNPGGGAVMVPIGSTTTWCCGFPDSNGSCEAANTINDFTPGTIVNEVVSATSSSSSATSSPTTSPTTTGACSSITPAASDSASSSSSCSNSNEVAVGAGVGIPLGIALIGVIGLFFRERRKNRFHEAPWPGYPNPPPSGYPGFPGPPVQEIYGKTDYPTEQDWASHQSPLIHMADSPQHTHPPPPMPPMPPHGGSINIDPKTPFGQNQRSELST